MLIECRVILPERSQVFEYKLADTFGGFTVWYGQGCWVDGDKQLVKESIVTYLVAVKPECTDTLKRLALIEAKAQKQQCVYFSSDAWAHILEVS